MVYRYYPHNYFLSFRANDYSPEDKLTRNNVFGRAASWRRIRTP